MIAPDPFFTDQIRKFAAPSVCEPIPAIYDFADFTAAGGLMSYAASITNAYRLAVAHAAVSQRAKRLAACPSSSRPNSSLRSISRPPRHLVSTCPRRCLPAPTR